MIVLRAYNLVGGENWTKINYTIKQDEISFIIPGVLMLWRMERLIFIAAFCEVCVLWLGGVGVAML